MWLIFDGHERVVRQSGGFAPDSSTTGYSLCYLVMNNPMKLFRKTALKGTFSKKKPDGIRISTIPKIISIQQGNGGKISIINKKGDQGGIHQRRLFFFTAIFQGLNCFITVQGTDNVLFAVVAEVEDTHDCDND